MSSVMLTCLLLQWVVILALVAGMFAMARQIGVLCERISPLGALTMDQGPKVGDPSPQLSLETMTGSLAVVGTPQEKSTLLFFLSPSCPMCKKLLPVLRSLRKSEGSRLQMIFASDGEKAAHTELADGAAADGIPYVLSARLGQIFRVGRLPHAVLIGTDGRIRAKGLVNSREHLESLLIAGELGVASIQEFLERADRDPEMVAAWRKA